MAKRTTRKVKAAKKKQAKGKNIPKNETKTPAKKGTTKIASKKSLRKRESVSISALGVCKMVYMGNTYCEDGITKRQCELKVQNYPGATVTWTAGGSCP